jgi:hypothetical protein
MFSHSVSYSQASLGSMSSQVMVTNLGVRGRDGEIRTRGLLLPNQLHGAARRSAPSPDVPLTCINAS